MIIQIYRAGVAVHSIDTTDSSYANRNLMGEETAYLEFYTINPVNLQMGDYATVLGHTYFIHDPVVPVRDKSRLKYQLTLYGTQYELEKVTFFILDTTGVDYTAKTTWNCTPFEFLNQLVVNMKRVQPLVDWRAGECQTANAKDLELHDTDCLETLRTAAELWSCDYYVDEFTVNFKKIEVSAAPLYLEVGHNKGLRGITVNKSGNSKVITRLYPYGSAVNMPNGQRLSIPPVDAAGSTIIADAIMNFDEIFPRIECVVDQVSVSFGYTFVKVNPALTFSVADYLVLGTTPTIVFLTGQLEGLEFHFVAQPDNQYFRLEPLTITGGVVVPGPAGYNPARGDEFAIRNINMPTLYVTAAKAELHAAAVAALAVLSKQKLKLNVDTDDLYFDRNNTNLYLGQTINIKSSIVPFLAPGVSVNVLGYKNYVNKPHHYDSLVVGDVYYTRAFGTVVQVVRNETIYKSTIAGGDKYYRHVQAEASAEWDVMHMLDKRPAVTVTDEYGKQTEAVVTYLAPNHLKINFSVPRTGYAECN